MSDTRAWLKATMVPDPLAPQNQSDEACAARLKLACELSDAGLMMMRQNLIRRHPEASEQQIEARLAAWLQTRPGAEMGDGEGVPRPWP